MRWFISARGVTRGSGPRCRSERWARRNVILGCPRPAAAGGMARGPDGGWRSDRLGYLAEQPAHPLGDALQVVEGLGRGDQLLGPEAGEQATALERAVERVQVARPEQDAAGGEPVEE